MVQIKSFYSYSDEKGGFNDEEVNAWIEFNKIKVKDIKHSVAGAENVFYEVLTIIYEVEE